MRHVVEPDDAPADLLGAKGAALAAAADTGVAIPEWFAITPEAFRAALRASGSEIDAGALATLRLCPDVANAVAERLARLSPDGGTVAVRSSAPDEDGAEHASAGQLDTFLDVACGDVPARIADVWRSAFGERALAYRAARGIVAPPEPPAVLIQRMLEPEAAGVAFSLDPVTGDRTRCVIAAVPGLGDALVSGEADAATWDVDATGAVTWRTPATEDAPLGDTHIREIAELARRMEQRFGRPQDIEWALADGRIHLLQTRPVTGLATGPEPDDALTIWDNSNIAESYNGVTTPLTFTFARGAYEEVYRQLCRTLGIPKTAIAAEDDTFANMIGLVRGRIYYNLLNWYRLLALLPGFASNPDFMERMMGVDRSLPASLRPGRRGTPTFAGRIAGRLGMAKVAFGLIANLITLPAMKRRFMRRMDDALADPAHDGMSAHDLVARYRDLERRLLRRWDAPLVNDLFAMIFAGVLEKLCDTWLSAVGPGLHNDLLGGEPGLVSVEPARRIRAMAAAAREHPGLVDTLRDGAADQIDAALPQALRTQFDDYLEAFGDRCIAELKLESRTVADDPLPLLRAIGSIAAANRGGAPGDASIDLRRRAETRASTALGRRPLRRFVFGWVLKNARIVVRDRENLRFERTRVFGEVRRIVLGLGRHFARLGLIEAADDVFWLTIDEALGAVGGTAGSVALRDTIAVRKAEFAGYADSAPPPDRFETRGPVAAATFRAPPPPEATIDLAAIRRGLAAATGTARGPARIVTDPRNARLADGDILVAQRTDPGWIALFATASGIVVEHGSLLSHAAIVARELGVPTVVSVPGVTKWLADGDTVEIDGTAGTVRRLASDAG